MKRWLVLVEVHTLQAALVGVPPFRDFRYYRWRWLAELSAWTDRSYPYAIVSARVIGRVTRKVQP